MDQPIGYSFLREHWHLPVFPVNPPARKASVTRITSGPDALLVPANVSPEGDAPLDHVLFALKHEGVKSRSLSYLPATPAHPLP